LLCPVRPGGSWLCTTPDALSLAHSIFAKGWMVAKAGAAIAIINAITSAIVVNNMMRFIVSATSFWVVRQPVALLALHAS